MTDTRYSVNLSATCDEEHLKDTVAVLQEATLALAGLDLEDFALRVYRLDNDEEVEEVPAAELPTAPATGGSTPVEPAVDNSGRAEDAPAEG